MQKNGLSRYRLAVTAGIPHATLNDICSGKTKLERCSAETVYKLAKTLGVSMEQLTESGIRETQREHSYEYGLPDYLQHDLDTYKEGLKTHSPLLDCYWGELYGSINMAEISDGLITPEHADYLRQKFLWRNKSAWVALLILQTANESMAKHITVLMERKLQLFMTGIDICSNSHLPVNTNQLTFHQWVYCLPYFQSVGYTGSENSTWNISSWRKDKKGILSSLYKSPIWLNS